MASRGTGGDSGLDNQAPGKGEIPELYKKGASIRPLWELRGGWEKILAVIRGIVEVCKKKVP